MLSPRRSLAPVAAALVAALLATGAGGRSVGAAPAPKFAAAVCGALSEWVQTVRGAAETAASATATDAKSAKSALVKLVRTTASASADARAAVEKAGTPSGAGGREIASTIREALRQAYRTINGARKFVANASGKNTNKLINTARATQDGIEPGLESLVNALLAANSLDSPALLSAFGAEGSCAHSPGDAGALTLSVTPAEAAPGTELSIAPAGVDAAAISQCSQSSTFVAELLGADGALLATGGETILVPEDASPGGTTVRLICYIPDDSGRRVIRGLCAPFTVAGGTPAAPAEPGACPSAPRVVVSQAVIDVESAISTGYNAILSPLGG